MVRGCICPCHATPAVPYPIVGFDPLTDEDVLAAAIACPTCRDLHARIFGRPERRPTPAPLPSFPPGEGQEA